MNKISKKDINGEYAFQFICTDELEELWKENNNVELRVKAKHSFSGFSKIKARRYYVFNNSVKKGSFKFGNTMEIY